MSKHIFVMDPGRIYGLDVVLPILYQLKEQYCDLKVTFYFMDSDETPFNAFKDLYRHPFLLDMVNELGVIKKIIKIQSIKKRSQKLHSILVGLFQTPLLFRVLVSKRSIVFYSRHIPNGLLSKLIVLLNGISGRSFCYFMAQASFKENIIQNFDKDGNRRVGFYDDLIQPLKERSDRVNVGDGLLIYHPDNLEFLEKQGYKKNIIIGYPMMFPAFQKYLKKVSPDYRKGEIGEKFEEHTIISVFLNKYFGQTSGCNDQWAQNRLNEVVEAIGKKFPKCYIMVRAHPTVSSSKAMGMIKNTNIKNIKLTYLSVYVLGFISKLTISIGQSSASIYSLACGAPSIDYGTVQEAFYEQFPSGSLYADFGVQVAYTSQELEDIFNRIDPSDRWIDVFQKRLDHKMNLDIFTNYWY